MQKGFALVVVKANGSAKIHYLDLSWSRNKADRACASACAKHLAEIRVAQVSFDYLGMGKLDNLKIVKVY